MSQGDTPGAATRTEVFACDGPVEVDVNIRNGRLDVLATDVPGIRVRLSIEPGAARRWEQGLEDTRDRISAGEYAPSDADAHALRDSEVSFSDEHRRLLIRTPRSFRRVGIGVTVEVPDGSRLAARFHRGSLTTSGVLTGLRVGTGSGDIRTEWVNGDVDAATGSGDLRLGRIKGRVRARSGSGEIEVDELDGEGARVTTGSGDVRLGVVQSDVQARTGSGRVVVSEAASGRLDLVTGSGDVTVSVRPGVAAEIDLMAGSGQARSELDVADRPPADTPAVRVRARTGSGDAVVARAGEQRQLAPRPLAFGRGECGAAAVAFPSVPRGRAK